MLFRIKLFYEAKGGTLELDFYRTQVNLWQNVPAFPMATANSRSLVLTSDYAGPPDNHIRIYDVQSIKYCALREVSCEFIPTFDTYNSRFQVECDTVNFLRDDWYLICFDRSKDLYLAAIHFTRF